MKVMLTLGDTNFTGEINEVPVMYDITNDTRRPVTQADVDKWLEMQATFAKILMAVRESKSEGK